MTRFADEFLGRPPEHPKTLPVATTEAVGIERKPFAPTDLTVPIATELAKVKARNNDLVKALEPFVKNLSAFEETAAAANLPIDIAWPRWVGSGKGPSEQDCINARAALTRSKAQRGE